MVKARAFLAKVAVMKRNVGRLQADGADGDLPTVLTYVVPDEVPVCAHLWCPFRCEVRHSHEPKLFHGCLVDIFGLKLLHENA